MSAPTPHIEALQGDFAPNVLMPGDPLRAKFIAETYLDNVKQINAVRGMLGYTGNFLGKPVSVMGSGMGMPSMGIYSWELFNVYSVDNIIRIGTAGAIDDSVNLRDIIAGIACHTNSNFAAQYGLPGIAAPSCSYKLLRQADEAAKSKGISLRIGTILTTDAFYDDSLSLAQWQKLGVLAVEMETAALYLTAARAGKHALAICTISDCPLRSETTTSQERQESFRQMMEVALYAFQAQ